MLNILPDASVDTVITSPPFFALRDYGTDGQIGLEATVDGWVVELRLVLRGLARVLKPTGALWLNLGDTYSHQPRAGAPSKSLLLGPERLALAMLMDGWIIRNKVIWAKTNPMPISVRDRLACTHEVVYFATRNRDYVFDLDRIRRPHRSRLHHPSAAAAERARNGRRPEWAGPLAGSNVGLDHTKANGRVGHPLGANPGDVWSHATSSVRSIHHAMFPETLIERPILATCPERVCANCGTPWQRTPADRTRRVAVIGDLVPMCSCDAGRRPGIVLDPFMGAGTTAIVAERHGRDWLGIELNPAYADVARDRIATARQSRSNRGSDEETPMAA
jgi:DNA modification methylase